MKDDVFTYPVIKMLRMFVKESSAGWTGLKTGSHLGLLHGVKESIVKLIYAGPQLLFSTGAANGGSALKSYNMCKI